ncbi:SET and MYND domain-containing protein 4 [Senna tora]|uniref:SET and MYND domain-containing protein 4 n=1 Tax=Senna tora TaxID=362788 RepID=A0A834T7M4_9FABA|nr:SET and MYND domain-containing protein 4 [Senna tora]
MESLKTAIPERLRRMIGESTTDDLPVTCSSLHHFFLHFEPFHQLVSDLADPKNALCGKSESAALESKQLGNQYFLKGDYMKALNCYTKALRVAPLEASDLEKNLVATLYINRATVLHKLDLSIECLRDCTRALQMCPSYAKAWYRRGKANASLGNNKDAICDLNVAKSMESSLGGKKQIESELKNILDQCERTSSVVQHKKNSLDTIGEMPQIKLQLVTMPDKGRGMVSTCDISPSSLVHREEPYAMIILKQCRETHCHYCLNDLPADSVPCRSCSIPQYCSQQCQIQAGGQVPKIYPDDHGLLKNLPSDLGKYVAEIILGNDFEIEDIPEHKHECQGVHWSAVLPSEIVLAGRVLAKFLQKNACEDITNFVKSLELSHCYTQLPSDSKLELHIYAIVLLYCLQHSDGSVFSMDGVSVSQVIIIFSQIKVNCMTVVRMRSIDAHGLQDQFGDSPSSTYLTSNVEQVRVGKAIYKYGSLFNHSCQPNIHAYFLSRTLCIRTTKVVAAGCQLELSYGPQVGLWECKDRHTFLKDEYAFQCQCSGCSEFNLSDIVLNAFHCVNLNCSGTVLESSVVDREKLKIKHFSGADQVDKSDDIYQVCVRLSNQNGGSIHIQPGCCLKCGSYRDLESTRAVIDKAWICIKRLQDSIISKEISNTTISDALESLCLLRSNLHAYNKRIAEAEDSLAQAFCIAGKLQLAMDHSKASLLILEKLYDPDDIVIAHEIVKLCSIQISMGDKTALDSISRICDIFSRYYGPHAHVVFPYLQYLRKEAENFLVKA